MTKPWTQQEATVIIICFVAMLATISAGKKIASQLSKGQEPSRTSEQVSPQGKHLPATSAYDRPSAVWRDATFAMPTTPAQRKRPPKQNLLPREKKPNIILILTDDQDIELGSMGFMPKTQESLARGAHFLRLTCPRQCAALRGAPCSLVFMLTTITCSPTATTVLRPSGSRSLSLARSLRT
uniref:Putative sulfatase n=1 Tax=Amblyomma cajennense TaxID=34607 RepID=A0A023FC41_AMBCJ